ncbi:MAG: radical SAM protein [Dehalococcoidia bacterium]
MKVVFIQKDTFAKTSIMALSAVLKAAGHETEVVIDCLEKDSVMATIASQPDIIAFSINIYEAIWMRETGTKLKQQFAGPIICGGPHPTYLPELTLREEYLDAVCRGEGEDALLDYVNAIENGAETTGIANFWVKKDGQVHENELRPLREDLDSLPFWDRAIYDKYPVFRTSHGGVMYHYAVMASRGCLYDCTFCINSAFKRMYRNKGKIFRRRSVENVIEELKEIKQRNVKQIDFEDDTLSLPPREWINDLLKRYAEEIRIPFQAQTSANLVDEDLVRRLKEANCHTMSMGIESGNEHFRKNAYRKHVSDEDIKRAAHLFRKYGLKFQTFNMAGAPDETLDMVYETYDLNLSIKPDLVRCTFLHPIPETEIYDYAVSKGLIDEASYLNEIGDHWVFISTIDKLNPGREMANLQQLMGPGVMLRLPRHLVAFMAKLPLGKIYRLLLAVSFLVGFYRINTVSLPYFLKLSVTHYARDVLTK